MLKETETEETIGFLVTFLSLMAFQFGGGGTGLPAPPLATPMKVSQSVRGTVVGKLLCKSN